MSRWYKQSNALAKSLGIPGGTPLYQELQKWEKEMKSDGNWQKVLDTRKKSGAEEAINLAQSLVKDYEERPEVTCINVEFEGRTPTGGEWYTFGRHYEYYELQDDYGDNKGEFLNYHANDQVHKKMKEALQEKAEELIRDIVWNLKIKLENRKEKMLEYYEATDGRQMAFPFYDVREKLDLKYEKLIERQKEKLWNLEKEVKDLDPNDEVAAIEWFEENFNEDIDIDEFREDAENEVWEEHIESMREELGELESTYSKHVTGGGGWCISQPSSHFEQYLMNGDEFTILRRNGKPRVAIRSNEGEGIIEIQGLSNKADNLTGLDLIDLMHLPYYDFDDIKEGIVNSPGVRFDEDDLKNHIMESLTDIDDSELNPELIEDLTGDNYGITELAVKDTETMVEMLEYIYASEIEGSKIEETILKGISNNLDDISFSYEEANGWGGDWTWGHEIIEVMNQWDFLNEYFKIIFGGQEEILSAFFDSLSEDADPQLAYNWAVENADKLIAIWGDKAVAHFKKLGLDYGNLEGIGDIKQYVLNENYKEDNLGKFNTDKYYYIMKSLFANRIELDGFAGYVDMEVINNLWEFGQLVVPPMGHSSLLNDICTNIIETINRYSSNESPEERAAILLYICLDNFTQHMDPVIYKNLWQFTDLKEAFNLVSPETIGEERYNSYATKLGLPLSGQTPVVPPVVEGLPNAPIDPVSGPPLQPPVNQQIQAKKRGWYKG